MERALEGEMTAHLGYERHAESGKNSGNSRNGKGSKRVLGDTGTLEITVPRDRNGDFEPKLISKRQRRLPGFDDNLIALYARGMTTRKIQGHLKELYGVEVSPVVRAALDRILAERPGIGSAPLFPSRDELQEPISRHLADAWLRKGEKLAELEPQRGSLWHAYRRKWATERKHFPMSMSPRQAVGRRLRLSRPPTSRPIPRLCYASFLRPVSCGKPGESGQHAHEHAHRVWGRGSARLETRAIAGRSTLGRLAQLG